MNAQCNPNGGGYIRDYARALSWTKLNAADTLQPVLLLGRYGLEENPNISQVGKWAKQQGAIVITVDKLSFQDDVVWWHKGMGVDHLQGPYMRMDIPQLTKWIVSVAQRLPEICPLH
jgi:hypothetical protein